MNGGKLKVSTLSGYRTALKDVYRQKRFDLPSDYLDDLTTFFRGLKRVEADNDQAGGDRKPGKEPLTFSLYTELAERTLSLKDNGFAHCFCYRNGTWCAGQGQWKHCISRICTGEMTVLDACYIRTTTSRSAHRQLYPVYRNYSTTIAYSPITGRALVWLRDNAVLLFEPKGY
ncbi:hypothetical protein JG688_00017530 [Phytophthora aleatoria]|uniref:Core-binding (CB) domain-containing protein n=1 Tax=Phytophthora aleatoria TaxID=2496075 RepID=A0A8J5IAC1_9STRA|nr:hypothetical protein JG688_00017530 [Phytophthora aleatoria]